MPSRLTAFFVHGKHAVDHGTIHTERGRNRARRLTAGVHPLRQSGFRLVERLGGPIDAVTTGPTADRHSTKPLTALVGGGFCDNLSRGGGI